MLESKLVAPVKRHRLLGSFVSGSLCLASVLCLHPAQAQALPKTTVRVVGVPSDATCSGGLIYDDGSLEDALGGGGGDPQDQKIVEYVTPTSLPAQLTQVCVAFTRIEDLPGNASMDFSIVFFAADGDPVSAWPTISAPSTPLAVIPAHIDNVPVYPDSQFYAIDTSQAPVLNGSAFIGMDWNPSENGPSPKVWASVDTSGITDVMPIFRISDVDAGIWMPLTSGQSTANYVRAMGIRAEQEPAGSVPPSRPSGTPSFHPQVVLRGTPSTLTLALANRNTSAAVLTSDFVNVLPNGVSIATPSNAATSCTNGIVSASTGGSAISLAAGAAIPASATCTVSVSVVPASGGIYIAEVASDDLQTDLGNNTALPSRAKLVVSTGGGVGGSVNENFDEVAVPELPLGWTSPVDLGISIWTTVSGEAYTPPTAAHAPDAPRQSDFSLTSPTFTPGQGAVLSFRQKYEFDNDIGAPRTCFDGGVLEISTDDGSTFVDIIDAGGVFKSGGYSCTIAGDNSGNPIGGRQGWGGTTGSLPFGGTLNWMDVQVDLDALTGQRVILRWREGANAYNTFYSSGSDWPGWWIDSVAVSNTIADDTIFKNGFDSDVLPPRAAAVAKEMSPAGTTTNTGRL